jgi:hypothetical protein
MSSRQAACATGIVPARTCITNLSSYSNYKAKPKNTANSQYDILFMRSCPVPCELTQVFIHQKAVPFGVVIFRRHGVFVDGRDKVDQVRLTIDDYVVVEK